MARQLSDYFTEDLRNHLAIIWPEVVAATTETGAIRGIWIGEAIELVPFDLLQPPYAVIIIPDWAGGDWAMGISVWEPWVHIYYVASTESTSSTPRTDGRGVRNRLEELVAYLWPPAPATDPLTWAQVLEVGPMTTSRSIPFNQQLKGKKLPLLAGRAMFKMLIEEGLS